MKVPGGQGLGVKGGKARAEEFDSTAPGIVDDSEIGVKVVVGFDKSEADPGVATAEADFARGCRVRKAGCCWDVDLASGFLAAGGNGSLSPSSKNND